MISIRAKSPSCRPKSGSRQRDAPFFVFNNFGYLDESGNPIVESNAVNLILTNSENLEDGNLIIYELMRQGETMVYDEESEDMKQVDETVKQPLDDLSNEEKSQLFKNNPVIILPFLGYNLERAYNKDLHNFSGIGGDEDYIILSPKGNADGDAFLERLNHGFDPYLRGEILVDNKPYCVYVITH